MAESEEALPMYVPLIHQKPINLRSIKHLIGESPEYKERVRAKQSNRPDVVRADRLLKM